MHLPLSVDSRGPSIHLASVPRSLWLGLTPCLLTWWTAWFGPAPFSEYTFIALWLGSILQGGIAGHGHGWLRINWPGEPRAAEAAGDRAR